MTATLPVLQSTSCDCAACRGLCRIWPGWLTPRDVKRLATHLNVEPRELFATHLAWDTWYGWPEDTLVAIPASRDGAPGDMTHREWFGALTGHTNPCALQDADGHCTIHAAKPRECRTTFSRTCATNPMPEDAPFDRWHELIARAWARPAARRWQRYLQTGEE